jgi:hypothetical protein
MFVKPAPGLVVRDPIHFRPLPAEGAEVPESTYWHCRLRDGDVTAATPPAAAPVAAEPAQEAPQGAAIPSSAEA